MHFKHENIRNSRNDRRIIDNALGNWGKFVQKQQGLIEQENN